MQIKKIIWVIFILTWLCQNVSAHRVNIFAWVEGNMIHTQSRFSDGKMAQNAKIEVLNSQGNQLLTGLTDEKGEFSFEIPQKTELTVVLNASMGHKGKWTIPKEELSGVKEKDINPLYDTGNSQPESKIGDDTNHGLTTACLKQKDIQRMMENTFHDKLTPIVSKLNQFQKAQQESDLKDALGGLGYIFGLVGVYAYFKARERINQRPDAQRSDSQKDK